VGASGGVGRRAHAQYRARRSEATNDRFLPAFRACAPSVVDFANADDFGVGVAAHTLDPMAGLAQLPSRAGADGSSVFTGSSRRRPTA
jgi:hypothetical protein